MNKRVHILFSPKLESGLDSFHCFCADVSEAIYKVEGEEKTEKLQGIRQVLRQRIPTTVSDDDLPLLFSQSLLLDLLYQGWILNRDSSGAYYLDFPSEKELSSGEIKDRVRKGHLFMRDAQLREASVAEFIKKMERRQLTTNGWRSIFSLMREGSSLKRKLESVAEIQNKDDLLTSLNETIQPYIQFVDGDNICEHTGFRLMDIWRYFRYTWVNDYKSLPGRSMMILIRDAAVSNHPVIGIAALGSSMVQYSVRDKWIGWDQSVFLKEFKAEPTLETMNWLFSMLDRLLGDIYLVDLIEEGLFTHEDLSNPSDSLIKELREFSEQERTEHTKFPHKAKVKKAGDWVKQIDWEERAKTHLFRSKRALAVSDLLSIRYMFRKYEIIPGLDSIDLLHRALERSEFGQAIKKLIRRIKSERVGIDLMDIIVAGAVAPYNHILGGKLVCMLLTSPEVVEKYTRKYEDATSIIASSMKGAPAIREPRLVFLGTTSLYGVGSSQYNRIKVPAEEVGGKVGREIKYANLGNSEGFGSFHFSKDTMRLGETLVGRRKGGKRVNSIFGEGANPKMRKIKEAIELVGLESNPILKHGNTRVVYGIPLALNFRDVLLGQEKEIEYIFSQDNPKMRTKQIASFWLKRWLQKRIKRKEILDMLEEHTLAYPITHGARVQISSQKEDWDLFSSTWDK